MSFGKGLKLGIVWLQLNSLPNGKMFARAKLKAFADDNITVARMMISLFIRVENNVGKIENAGSFSLSFFQSLLLPGL